MRKLRIAQIAPCWYPIPPQKYGGIERVVSLLTEELVRRGHQVTLFASGDSKTKARLVPVYPKSLVKMGIPWSENILNAEAFAAAAKMAGEFDIIHSHVDHLSLLWNGLIKTPTLLTFHSPMALRKNERMGAKFLLYTMHKKSVHGVFISRNHKKKSLAKFASSWVVYNGIDVSRFSFRKDPEDYFVWAGRFDPYKGPENALYAARRMGVKLSLAGKIDPGRREYFAKKIKPYLSKKIRYLGELTQKELRRLLGGARACLYPVEWEEPFGLIMVEAMACGTPVIGYRRGSVPEIVKDGTTGFVVENRKELIAAMKKVDQIDRAACRRRVQRLFTIQTMVDGYEKSYSKILKK